MECVLGSNGNALGSHGNMLGWHGTPWADAGMSWADAGMHWADAGMFWVDTAWWCVAKPGENGDTGASIIGRMTCSWRITASPLSPTRCPLIAALSTLFDGRWLVMVS